jgi:hypothetical protein
MVEGKRHSGLGADPFSGYLRFSAAGEQLAY